jgi:hypothetical protein
MRSESSSVCCCPGDFSRYSHRYPLVVNVCASSTGEREYQAAFLLASHGSTSLVARVERVVFLYALRLLAAGSLLEKSLFPKRFSSSME